MRILVFLDTPRQRSYVASVAAAVATVPDAVVVAGGPGATDSYFGLAHGFVEVDNNDDKKTGGEVEEEIGLATRVRLTLAGWRERWNELHIHEGIQSTIQNVIELIQYFFKNIGFLNIPLRSIRIFLRPFRIFIRPARTILTPIKPLLRYRPTFSAIFLSRFLRRGLKIIEKLPPLLRSLALASLRGAIALTVFSTMMFNGAGITQQMVQRELYIREASRMIRRSRPDVLVVMEDNVEGLTGVATFAARQAGVPVLILPDYIPNPIEPATYYWNSKPHRIRTLLDWLVAIAYPKWKYRHNGRKLLRLPSVNIVAYHLLRCDPPAPWILNSGYAAAIALDSSFVLSRYRALGFRNEKLHVIGTAQDDRLHEQFIKRDTLRKALLQDLGLPEDRPIILCAFPPNQYTTADFGSFEYPNYAELVNGWFSSLGAVSDRANIIVRPHPRTKPGELEILCPAGVNIVWMPTEELVPLCDLYVASVSTTIRWALGLGLPVLNYDCYRYAYGDFSSAKGILECFDRASFATTLDTLLADLGKLAVKSHADRRTWGQVDGYYAKRLLNMLQEVARTPFKAQSTHAMMIPGTTLIRSILVHLNVRR